MIAAIAALEVMDKEPPVWLLLLYCLATGAIGMLAARRRPILCVLFISLILLGALPLYLELRDSNVGEAILSEGGVTYLSTCGFAILAGIGMPLLGAYVGAKNLVNSIAAWRWTLGASGALLLGLTLFVGSGFVETAYYDYVFYPREKAGEGYIMPLRWQDIVAEVSIACALIALLLLSVYLLRSSLRPKATRISNIPANSD
ncbi:MAG TPA: hypothetical protein VJX29_10660 [Candidatus Acidoferrales bacterium]|nr:hypothetical protein [Candidatus Acidoferrales bacterium]